MTRHQQNDERIAMFRSTERCMQTLAAWHRRAARAAWPVGPRLTRPTRPDGLDKGWYVKPTVFVTTNDTAIGRDEIFGPVLVMMGYKDVDDAVAIANDSNFGLAGYVNGVDSALCNSIAKRMRTGWVNVNNGFDFHAPFGGYKRSGNGREWGDYGFHEYLEIKTILNYAP